MAAREPGAMFPEEAKAEFARRDAETRADPAYRRLMAIPDHLELTDAEFHALAGTEVQHQWQGHVKADPRTVVLGRVARQTVRKYMDIAIQNASSIEEEMAHVVISKELAPYVEEELKCYVGTTFTPFFDALATKLEEELQYVYEVPDGL